MTTLPSIKLTAIQKNGCALQYASDELKNDKEFVLKVVQTHGYALKFARYDNFL